MVPLHDTRAAVYATGVAEFFGILSLMALVGLALPARWGMRVALILALPFAFLVFDREVSDPGVGHGLGIAIAIFAFMGVAVLSVGVCVRAAWEYWRNGAVGVSGRDAAPLRMVTAAIFAAMGFWCAIPAFAALSWYLGGIGIPQAAHVGIVALALSAAGLSVVYLHGNMRVLVVACILSVAGLVADSGLNYPARVMAEADRTARGAPRCLLLGHSLAAPAGHSDLMAMTIGKARSGPSAILLFVDFGAEQSVYRWSFKGMVFVDPPGPVPEAACTSHRDPLLPMN